MRTDLAETGVVGVLRAGGEPADAGHAIGLRADLDALHIHERSGVAQASRNAGRMHASGHDGHTTTLLAAAVLLARGSATFAAPSTSYPRYDLNDDTLAIGASYWVTLARQELGAT